jgi:hypothetical protein
MHRVAEVATQWPTLGFTVLLAFFLMWWILSLIVSGLDGTDLDTDGDGVNDDLFGKVGHFIGIGSLPFSFGLTVLAFVAWSTSLLLSLLPFAAKADGRRGSRGVPVGVGIGFGIGIGVVALVVGVLCTRRVASLFAPVFDFHGGPRREDAKGAKVKVRTQHVDENFGEAEVLSGPRIHSIVRVRAKAGVYQRGDIAMIVDYQPEADTFALVPLDESLH